MVTNGRYVNREYCYLTSGGRVDITFNWSEPVDLEFMSIRVLDSCDIKYSHMYI